MDGDSQYILTSPFHHPHHHEGHSHGHGHGHGHHIEDHHDHHHHHDADPDGDMDLHLTAADQAEIDAHFGGPPSLPHHLGTHGGQQVDVGSGPHVGDDQMAMDGQQVADNGSTISMPMPDSMIDAQLHDALSRVHQQAQEQEEQHRQQRQTRSSRHDGHGHPHHPGHVHARFDSAPFEPQSPSALSQASAAGPSEMEGMPPPPAPAPPAKVSRGPRGSYNKSKKDANLTAEEKKERLRLANKKAAERSREKRRQKQDVMEDTLTDLRKTNETLRSRLAALQADSADHNLGPGTGSSSPVTSAFPGQPGSQAGNANPNVYSVHNRLGLDWKYITKLRAEMINSRLALVEKCERVRELQRALARRTGGRSGYSGNGERHDDQWDGSGRDGESRHVSRSLDGGDAGETGDRSGTPLPDAPPPKDELSAYPDPALMSLNDRDLLSETRVRLLTTDIDRKIAAAQEKALDLALRKLDEDRTELGQFRELLIGEMLARGLIASADEIEAEADGDGNGDGDGHVPRVDAGREDHRRSAGVGQRPGPEQASTSGTFQDQDMDHGMLDPALMDLAAEAGEAGELHPPYAHLDSSATDATAGNGVDDSARATLASRQQEQEQEQVDMLADAVRAAAAAGASASAAVDGSDAAAAAANPHASAENTGRGLLDDVDMDGMEIPPEARVGYSDGVDESGDVEMGHGDDGSSHAPGNGIGTDAGARSERRGMGIGVGVGVGVGAGPGTGTGTDTDADAAAGNGSGSGPSRTAQSAAGAGAGADGYGIGSEPFTDHDQAAGWDAVP